MQRIEEEEDLDYNLMALCATDEQTILLRALKNAIAIEKVKQSALHTQESAQYWKSNDTKPMQIHELLGIFGITHNQLVEHVDLADSVLGCMKAEHNVAILKRLVKEQDELKNAYITQRKLDASGNSRAGNATDGDFTDATYEILKTLVDAGIIPANSRR
jgi:hypothetical protein